MSDSNRLPDLSALDLDRRTVLRLLGAGTGALALGGASMARAVAGTAGATDVPRLRASRAVREQIAQYVTNARFEHLSAAAIEKAKEQIVFFVGRAFGNLLDRPGRRAQRLKPPDAAWTYAALFGDMLVGRTPLHTQTDPGAITLAAALAAGEARRVSGRELLLALVVGYEVGCKVARAAAPACQEDDAWWSYGATAAAGRLLSLDCERMTHALAHATGYADDSALPRSLDDLGYWEILGAVHRPYHCPGNSSAAPELLAELLERHALTSATVAHIEVVLPKPGSHELARELAAHGPFHPACRACSSVRFLLARVLLDGSIDVARINDAGLANDPAVAQAMQTIDVRFESGHAQRWTRLAVRATDGRELQRESHFFTCELTPDTWHGWLRHYGRQLLPSRQLLALNRLIHDLENLDDVARLVAIAMPALASVPT